MSYNPPGKVNSDGYLVTEDFINAVALGDVPGWSYNVKFGINEDIDTGSDPEDVWDSGDFYPGQPPQTEIARVLNVSSSSGNDTALGSGARTVRIFGLDTNFNEIQEDVTLNGTTNVQTVNEYKRAFRAYVLTSGGDETTNQGAITALQDATSDTMIYIGGGKGQTQTAAFTVPNGKTCYITSFYASMSRVNGSAGSALCRLLARRPGGSYNAERQINITNSLDYDRRYTIILPARTDVIVRCNSVSDSNTRVQAEVEYLLKDD